MSTSDVPEGSGRLPRLLLGAGAGAAGLSACIGVMTVGALAGLGAASLVAGMAAGAFVVLLFWRWGLNARRAGGRVTAVGIGLFGLFVGVFGVKGLLDSMAVSWDRPYIQAMKGSLRTVASAQDSFYREYRQYAPSLEELEFGRTSLDDGVTVTIDAADPVGWRATARSTKVRETCSLTHTRDGPALGPVCTGRYAPR